MLHRDTRPRGGRGPGRTPAHLVGCGNCGVVRDETIAYASRLLAEGVPVELHVWPGGFHGYENFVPDATLSRETVNARVNVLRRASAARTRIRYFAT
ncbi:alpha/beta hydrolase [Rhodococcus sp. NPDC057529]|uniref:alpha/beta hydrolase n=1 Tax=Rhodococcus sp. NPDC057529 TaxID=3346158 RepID=UPI0036719273